MLVEERFHLFWPLVARHHIAVTQHNGWRTAHAKLYAQRVVVSDVDIAGRGLHAFAVHRVIKGLVAVFRTPDRFHILLRLALHASTWESQVTHGNAQRVVVFHLFMQLVAVAAGDVGEDGKHIIQGPMYDVSGAQPVNVTNQLLMKNLNALEKEMIVYKAAQEKHVITVFTEITCGYCHKLHEEMKDYNALGITVRYLAFPRAGVQSQPEQDMKAIWCAKDRNKAFDDAMNGKGVQPASCDIDIANHYALGVQFGVTGTPAIVLSNGYVVPGYQGPKEMKEFLDAHQKQFGGK